MGTPGRLPDIARKRNIDLVLHRPRLTAIAHAQIALALIRAERDEQDLRALIDKMATKLRELGIVADHNPDRPAIGLDRTDVIGANDRPPIGFVRRRMNLRLRMDRAVAQADIADIDDVAVLVEGRMGAADDVDVIMDGPAARAVP